MCRCDSMMCELCAYNESVCTWGVPRRWGFRFLGGLLLLFHIRALAQCMFLCSEVLYCKHATLRCLCKEVSLNHKPLCPCSSACR